MIESLADRNLELGSEMPILRNFRSYISCGPKQCSGQYGLSPFSIPVYRANLQKNIGYTPSLQLSFVPKLILTSEVFHL